MTVSSNCALELENVNVSYGTRKHSAKILHDVSLTLASGQMLAIVGPSGCGKTTLLRTIAGLTQPGAGSVKLSGSDVTKLPPEKRNIGLVPQDAALFPHLTVAENVAFGLPRKLGKQKIADRVNAMLQLVHVEKLASRKPAELSGGQAQRVALARALAPEPELVLLDEPFSGLDAALRIKLRQEVAEILRAAGAAALLVTHDQDEALSVADQIAVMNHGRIVQFGSPQQVYTKPATVWAANFLGTCTILRSGAMVRPEDVTLHPIAAVNAHALAHNSQIFESGAPGTVQQVEFLGHTTLYRVVLDDGTHLHSRQLGKPALQVGERILAELAAELHFLNPAELEPK